MRELVDQAQRRPPREDRVEVHLLDDYAAVGHRTARDHFERAQLRVGLGASVGLHEADDHVHATRAQGVGVLEHREGLAHPGRRTDVDAQPSPLVVGKALQPLLGARPLLRHTDLDTT